MVNPCCDIRIKNNAGKVLYFDYVSDLEIVQTWRNLTKTAVVYLPRNIKDVKGDEIHKLIQSGNEIVIRLGFDLQFVEEFRGEVVYVDAQNPVKIYCEDYMRKLKRAKVSKSYRNATLGELIKDIVPAGIKTEVLDATIGAIRFNDTSVAKVLDELKNKWGLFSYFRGDTLCSGFAYPISWSGNPDYIGSYHFQKNIIESELSFKSVDEVRLQVNAISMLPDNRVVRVEVGDPNGEQRTLHFYNIENKQELKRLAEAELQRFKYSGYRGSFTTWGFPYVEHGYRAELGDYKFPERTGKYYIDRVVVNYGDGYYRTIELGAKVN